MRVCSGRLESLASPAFIAALALLVLNDFALKPLFHNALTGKLSDFAGLFALTLFVATLWPQHRRLAASAIAAAFTLWKTSYAEPLIDALNSVSPFALGRAVDFTDLLALPMVPLAAWLAPRLKPWPLPRALQLCLAVLAPIAFAATSRGYSQVRATADLPASTAVDDAALQRFFDDLARRHGMACAICDPIGEGRVYGEPGIEDLTVNFAADRRVLYFAATDSTSRADKRYLAKLEADIREGLDESFPGATIWEATDDYDEPLEITTFTLRSAGGVRLSVERAESARRAHGLETERNFYYAGRRRSWDERDLVLTPNYGGNDTLSIWVRYTNDAYEPLYRAVADDLAERLSARFGPENVTRAVRQ
ncbi:MAG: hypothetical protein EHM50_06670 [Lysobacterales bacterium]|nr:MAG: hypothetical protein EHM50_06670 [Xanthomonadales bacterium]